MLKSGKGNYGHIDGMPEGTDFPDSTALYNSEVHRTTCGIATIDAFGAESTLLNGEYDNHDDDDEIVYTGGGPGDQKLTKGNLPWLPALMRECQ